MRRRLHDLFGWHAWVPTIISTNYRLTVMCKCGATTKLAI